MVLKLSRVTGKQFAADAKIPYRTLQDYLGGKRLPGAEHLARMERYGLDIGWLLTGEMKSAIVTEFHGHFKPITGILAADKELADRALSLADRIGHEFTVEAWKEGKEPLRPSVYIMLMWEILNAISGVINKPKFVERVLKARQEGWSADQVFQLIDEPMSASLRQMMRTIGYEKFRDPLGVVAFRHYNPFDTDRPLDALGQSLDQSEGSDR